MSLKNFLNSFSIGQLDINGAGIQLPDYISFSFDPTTGRLCLVDNRQNPASPAYKIACWDSNAVTPVTYAELLALAVGNNLESGAFYLITDFRTRHIIPNTAVVNTGAIEPLIVQAASASAIHPNAISTIFAPDEILYELVDSTTAGGDRGRIYYRRDTVKNNSTWYDWRVVLFRRWDDGAGNFVVLTDNGNAFADFFTFNNSASANDCNDTMLGRITAYGIATFGAPSSQLNNMVFNSICLYNEFSADAFDCTFTGGITGGNKIMPVFIGNTLGTDFILNTVSAACFGNIIGDDCRSNVISEFFANNQIGDVFHNNVLGINYVGNTIGDNFISNNIGDNFTVNIVGDGFLSNEIQDNFMTNTIGNDFTSNEIGNGFSANMIEDGFTKNEIKSNFSANVNIHDDFRKNTIQDDLNGIDFNLATFVYTDYTKNIFQRSDGSFQLSYIDNANTINYAAPNA